MIKGQMVQVMLGKLGITASFSRPRVSDDNAFIESLFRTCKYLPHFPREGFDDVIAARNWVHGFVDWYNHQHKHRGINYLTPSERHPQRWSGDTRNWSPAGAVWLNLEKENQPMKQAA